MVVIPTPFTQFGFNYSQIKAEKLHFQLRLNSLPNGQLHFLNLTKKKPTYFRTQQATGTKYSPAVRHSRNMLCNMDL